jgi:hypothetical protein
MTNTVKEFTQPDRFVTALNTEGVKALLGGAGEAIGAFGKSQANIHEYNAKAQIDIKKERDLMVLRGQIPGTPAQAPAQPTIQVQPAQTGPGAPPAGSAQNPYVVPQAQPAQSQPGQGQPLQPPPWQPRTDRPLQEQVEVRVPEEEMRQIREHDQRMIKTQEMLSEVIRRLDGIEGFDQSRNQGAPPPASPPMPPPGPPPASSPFGAASTSAPPAPFAAAGPAAQPVPAPQSQPAQSSGSSQWKLVYRFECRVQPCNGKVYHYAAVDSLQATASFKLGHLRAWHPEKLGELIGEGEMLKSRRLQNIITMDEEGNELAQLDSKYFRLLAPEANAATQPPAAPAAPAIQPVPSAEPLASPSATNAPSGTPPSSSSSSPSSTLEANGGIAVEPKSSPAMTTTESAPVGGEQRAVFPIRCKKCPETEAPSKYIALTWEEAAQVWVEYHFSRKHPTDAVQANQKLMALKIAAAQETDLARREVANLAILNEATRLQAEIAEFLPTEDLPKEQARLEPPAPASPNASAHSSRAPSESSPRKTERGSAGAGSDLSGPPGKERTDDSEGEEEAEDDGSAASSKTSEDEEHEEVGRESGDPGGRMKAARPEVKPTTQPLKADGSTRRRYRKKGRRGKKGAKNKAEKTEKTLTKDEEREASGDDE